MSEWLIPLITLTALEIVLGIDNIIFLAILVGRVPKEQQRLARNLGLILALFLRLGLLFFITLLMAATEPLFYLPAWTFPDSEARAISFKDLVLILGGLFLVAKATYEIHHKLESPEESHAAAQVARAGSGAAFWIIILQILAIDLVFSLDSVITAVGMVKTNAPAVASQTEEPKPTSEVSAEKPAEQGHGLGGLHPTVGIWIIVVAMIITCLVMLLAAGPVSDFVGRHPTLKILALSFLILIGVLLVAEGFGQHINKGYIYFAMAFSFVVELLNMRMRSVHPVALHEPHPPQV